jgi:hypothetical protein
MRSRRLRVARITHTSHHYRNDLVYTGTPKISMVTIPSSIASCKRAFEATGPKTASSMTLFLPILCTLICVSPYIVRSHLPDWQYPLSLRPTFIQKSPCLAPLCTFLIIVILRALISPVLSAAAYCVLGSMIMDSLFFVYLSPDTAYGNTHTLALIDQLSTAIPRLTSARKNSLT